MKLTFKDYQIQEIYQALKGSGNNLILVTDIQKEFITNWCNEVIMDMDIENAVQNGDNSVWVNWNVKYLWFFINKFNISIPKEKLLDFTLYHDFENYSQKNSLSIIETLEHFVDKSELEKRVTKNLSRNIANINIWKSNAAYAINNQIGKSFPYILQDLKDRNKHEHHRTEILELYFKKTQNFEALKDIIRNISTDQFRWSIIRILMKYESQYSFLKHYLITVLENDYELFDYRFSAAEYLIQLNDLKGLNFITDFILNNTETSFNFRERFNCLSHSKDINAVPVLIKILKVSKQPIFMQDKFYHNVESLIFTSLHNIGIQSEHNYIIVKRELENFIGENQNEFEHLNFIHLNIKRMEEQMYLNKSQSYKIEDAIDEFKRL